MQALRLSPGAAMIAGQNNPAAMVATEQRLRTKATLTLLGICTGLVADGELKDSEIHFLGNWLLDNRELVEYWPGNVIASRIQAIMADGVITEAERADLLETLKLLTGNDFIDTGLASPEASVPAELVGVTFDAPDIEFSGQVFCCTGRFIHGTRKACHRDIEALGGKASDNLTMQVDYLVIGALTQPDWAYQTYGRKIETAAVLRQQSGKPKIITEAAWSAAMKTTLLR